MRVIALTASVALVVIHWGRESAWFWVGLGLAALNVAGFLSASKHAPTSDRMTE